MTTLIPLLLSLILGLEAQIATIETVEATTTPPVILSVEDKIRSYDWDDNIAIFIANCESNLDPTRINSKPPDYSIGLFQINIYGNLAQSRPPEEWLKIPENNIDYAYKLYKEGGWERHWTICFNKYTLK